MNSTATTKKAQHPTAVWRNGGLSASDDSLFLS